ncbi:MAG: class I SAM-dependent methyltransferase [Rhizobiaceae bacterium]
MSNLKSALARLDRDYLAGSLKHGYHLLGNSIAKIAIARHHRLNWDIRHSKDEQSILAKLCEVHGSDKGWLFKSGKPFRGRPHTYTDLYEFMFSHCRKNVRRVFECGLGTNNPNVRSNMGEGGRPGASLRVWRDYFPNAQIVGVDIDSTVLFTEDRISTFQLDQTSRDSVLAFWTGLDGSSFDLMVDDGLHEFHAGICLFENSIDHLSADGVYVIEDVLPFDRIKYSRYFDSLTDRFTVHVIDLHERNKFLVDNSLILIRRKAA